MSFTGLTCKNNLTTQELLDANFLAKGQTPIDLLSPSENQQVTTANPTLSWSSKGVGLYVVQMATDANFSTMILNKEVSGISYTVANGDLIGVSSLATNTYYWRVSVARIASNLQSKPGSFFLVAIPAGGSGYAGAIYVNGTSTSNTQIGSKEAPYKKIQSAIAAADALRDNVSSISMDIYVAQGTYVEEINLIPGISIRGGHKAADWTRNIAANITTIQGPYDLAIRGTAAITTSFTSTTWIEGFTIQGATGNISYGIYLVNSSPTISNNTINGGTAVSGSYAIYNSSSSPLILNNNILGGTSSNQGSSGVYNSSSSPIISNNTIASGMAPVSYGLYNSTSSPTISNNTITCGLATGSSSHGIYNISSSPTIMNNTITGGPATTTSYGISMDLISLPIIRNNTIIITGGAATRYGIAELSTFSNPASIKNNAIFDFGTGGNFYVYRDADGVCNGGASNDCTSIVNMETDLNAEAGGTASGNINQNPIFSSFPVKIDASMDGADALAAYDGTTNTLEVTGCTNYVVTEYLEYDKDGITRQITACNTATGSGIVTFTPALSAASVANREIRLWGTNNTNLTIDLHLKAASPCDVRQGGLDLSSLFTTDRDGITRTASLTCGPANAGAQGWSIGAYEY